MQSEKPKDFRTALLREQGYFLQPLDLSTSLRARVEARDWDGVDREVRAMTSPGGLLFEAMRPLAEFSEIEFILAIRSSREFPDEDGIWHDDGSRVLAFSLSLTLDPSAIEGGVLGIRRRGDDFGSIARISTPPFGTMIVFATGQGGYEHRIHRVSQGERVIVAGWCS